MEIWYTSWSLWYVNNHAGSYIFKYEKESGLVNWQIASEAVYCFLNAWWYGPKRTWNYHESISIRFKSNSYHNWFIGKLWITAYPKLLLKNPRLFAGGKIPVVILALRHFLQHLQVLTYCGKMNHLFFFLCRNHLICTIAMFFRQLIVDYEQLYLCSRSLCSSKSKTGEVLLVHNYNKIILSGRKICGTWYLMNQLRYIRVSDSWRIWNTVRIKLFHHDEKGMEDLIYSSNFSVRCYLSLIQKNSRTFLACFIISFYTELIPKKTCLSRTCMFMGGPPVILIVAWIFCHHS